MKSNLGKRIWMDLTSQKSRILTGVGIVGFGTSLYLMAKAQKSADDILAERDRLCKENYVPSKREVFDLTWQCYVPTVLTGLFSAGCIIGGSYISAKEIAALTGSVAFLTANRDQLEKAVEEKYGKDALNEIKSKLGVRKPEPEVIITCAEETGYGNLLCYEGYSGRWFRCSEERVTYAEKKLNEDFINGNFFGVEFNDFYDYLGLHQTHFGHQFGWCDDGDDSYFDKQEGIEFVNTKIYDPDRGEEILYIDIYTYPLDHWYEY